MRRTPQHRRPRRVRWTPLERGMVAVSLVLMLGSAGFEAYRWIHPIAAPAAPRTQEQATATATAEASSPTTETASPTPEAEFPAPSETPTVAPSEMPSEAPTAEPSAVPPTATNAPPTATALIDFGATPLPTFTPLPTLVVGETPLVLEKTASSRTAKPGSPFSYFVAVRTASTEARVIEVRDLIDERLEVVEARSTSGTCGTANPVVCVLKASQNTPAEIIINVRVRGDVPPGTVLASQALARDDRRETAASERVTVTVESAPLLAAGDLAAATVPPTATATTQPAGEPAPAPTDPPAQDTAAQPFNTPESTAGAPTAEAVAQAATVQPTTAAVVVAAPQTQQPAPGLPPTLAPVEGNSGAQPVNPSTASPQLPRTAASLPTFGVGVGLMGIALALHGTRRVRRADSRFSGASAKLRQLGPLVIDAAEQQHATITEIERMRQQSEEMRGMLER